MDYYFGMARRGVEIEVERGLERIVALDSHATLCTSLHSISAGIGGNG